MLAYVSRYYVMDNIVKDFIKENKDVNILNLGGGL